VALFVGLLLFLAGIGVGVRPLGHATGSTVSVDSPPVAAVRNCGSALLTADYTSGALPPGSNLAQPANGDPPPLGWIKEPPCAHRLSTWRYPAVALLIAGVIAALAGFFIFRTRGEGLSA
jgi:ABC-type branched-subunit amino acid transport system permease subunit